MIAVQRGAACVRVHDVAATRQALAFASAIGAVRGGAPSARLDAGERGVADA